MIKLIFVRLRIKSLRRRIKERIMLLFGGVKRTLGLRRKAVTEKTFLYPTSDQFPFDEVCGTIVRELEKRNWQVPGIIVEFHDYGSGEQKMRMVSRIKGKDFKLHFCRVQGKMPGDRWNNSAAVTEIVIPKKEIHVYEDESGPTFYLYVGNDWENDCDRFVNGMKVNSKLNGEPRTYLEYKGGCDCRNDHGAAFEGIGFIMAMLTGDETALRAIKHTHKGCRPSLLVHTNDLRREYDPEGDEPRVFRTDEVMEEFRKYLEGVVLKEIISTPLPTEIAEKLHTSLIPFPESISSLFCFGGYRDAERINWGRACPEKLQLADRYGMSGGGYRLMSLGTPNDGTVPEIAYDGFLWCGIGDVDKKTPIESLNIPGHYRWPDREGFVISITPETADGIYVADHEQYEKRRKEIWDAIGDTRSELTDDEVADFTRARARTIIPITDYQGDYGQPVILINRELSLEEVKVASGPHEDRL